MLRIYSFTLVLALLSFSGFFPALAEDCTDAAVKQGVKLYEESNFPDAITQLEKAVRELQKESDQESRSLCLFKANIFIGMAYFGEKKTKEARGYFQQAARIVPGKSLSGPEYDDYANPTIVSLYESVRKQVQVAPPVLPKQAAPAPASAAAPTLAVQSNVIDAEVFVDEVNKGKAPVRIAGLTPGRHTIQAVHGTEKREQTYILEPGKEADIIIDFQSSGDISVASTPRGADIRIDGVLLAAKTPFLVQDSSAGDHVVSVAKEGFAESSQKVFVKAGEPFSVNVRLEPLLVKITSNPSGADVLWDNVARGKTPLAISGATPGKHKISLAKEGYETQTDTIEVRNSGIERPYTLREHVAVPSKKEEEERKAKEEEEKKKLQAEKQELERKQRTQAEELAALKKEEETRKTKDEEEKKKLQAEKQQSEQKQHTQAEELAALKKEEETRKAREKEDKKRLEAEKQQSEQKQHTQAEAAEALKKEEEEKKKQAEPVPKQDQVITSKVRFTIRSDGTVVDKVNKLMWLKNANRAGKTMNYEEAMKYCENLDYAGHKDWKLPSRDQWKTMVGKGGIDKTSPGHPFTNTEVFAGYWSSSVHPRGITTAYVFYLANGGVEDFNKSNRAFVWPVRYAGEDEGGSP